MYDPMVAYSISFMIYIYVIFVCSAYKQKKSGYKNALQLSTLDINLKVYIKLHKCQACKCKYRLIC